MARRRAAGETGENQTMAGRMAGILGRMLLVLTVSALVLAGMHLTIQFPRVSQRTVAITLNVFKLKTDHASRMLLNHDGSPYDLGGGFPWQNRILVPALLATADAVLPDWHADFTRHKLRSAYAGLIALGVLLACCSLWAWGCWYWLHAGGDGNLTLRAGGITLLFGGMLLVLATLGGPRWIVANDYYEIAGFGLALILVLERRWDWLLPIVLLLSLVRESSLFIGIIYAAVHGGLTPGRRWSPAAATHGLYLIAAAAIPVLAVRAYYLGGLRYALGMEMAQESYAVAVQHNLMLFATQSHWLLATHAFLGLLLLASAASWGGLPASGRRLILAGWGLMALTTALGMYPETRIFFPVMAVLLAPAVTGMLLQGCRWWLTLSARMR
ncbi:MAG TPA: hypothetical protein PKM88_12220 [bacterium]|nr:hypothetical protein [bacterium]